MRRYLMILVSSILSGICICFGATVYLVCASYGTGYKIMGAFLFGIGLFTIIHFGFWLYTGKVGMLLDNKPKYLLDLLVCVIGNFLGVMLLAFLIKLTSINDMVKDTAIAIVNSKQSDTWYSIFIKAMLCGVMIYLSVMGHNYAPYDLAKVLFAFLPIVLFILCGFEHCVANLAYYIYAGHISGKMILYFLLMILGNGIGAVSFDGAIKLVNYLKEPKKNYIQ